MSICGRCGKSNGNWQFCGSCGNRLSPDVPPPVTGSPREPVLEGLRAVVQRLVVDLLADPIGASSGRAFPSREAFDERPVAPRPFAESRTGRARLTVIQNDGRDGQSFAFNEDQIDIGRTEGALTFDDPQLAPRHARIAWSDGHYELEDLNTRNGVYQRVRAPADLEDGDHLLIGKQLLQFSIVTEHERAVSPSVTDGVVLFGTKAAPAWARLVQIALSGVAGDIFHLSRQDVVLGREQGDIVFSDDEFISRRHAQITLRQGRPRLEDLGSSNGTYLRVRGQCELMRGDFVRMGDQLLRFDLE